MTTKKHIVLLKPTKSSHDERSQVQDCIISWLKVIFVILLMGLSVLAGIFAAKIMLSKGMSSPSPSIVSKLDVIPPSPTRTVCVTSSTNVTENPVSINGFPATQKLIFPFVDTYRQPTNLVSKSKNCRSDGHCLMSFEIDIYETQLAAFNNAVPDCKNHPATWWITFNGQAPGPTIRVPSGHESLVRFNNKITQTFFKDSFSPCNAGGRIGRPVSIHHHGSASLAPFDGWAEDETCSGETKDYFYPNNRPVSAWYHDHALHLTADNAYLGLAGMYVVSAKKSDGGCGAPWNLEGVEEKLMILQDKVLDSKCQLFADVTGVHKDNLYGDINMVNGVPFPNQPLEAKPYIFRFLNGAVSRPFKYRIETAAGTSVSDKICQIIGADGGFRYEKPVAFPVGGLLNGVAERWDVYCDFSAYSGQNLYWANKKDDGQMDKTPMFCYSHLIAKITVGSSPATAAAKLNSALPAPFSTTLMDRVLSADDYKTALAMANNGKPHRSFVFGRSNGMWTINGETWDTAKIAASDVGQNTWEVWEFKSGGGWFHPVHVHLVDFFVIKRDGAKGGLEPFEIKSPKDVLYLGPSNTVYVIARFGAHKGDYMFHCHNLIHEDNDMMRAFRTINGTQGINKASVANSPYVLNPLYNIVYSNFKYQDPMLGETAAIPSGNAVSLLSKAATGLDLNLYRIFYPTASDKTFMKGIISNPWNSEWCALL